MKAPPTRRDPVKENLFVLIEDNDGKTGSMSVGNKEGSRTIAQPNLVSAVNDATTPPADPVHMDEEDIRRIFGAALAAQPPPYVTFTLYFKSGKTDFTEESAKRFLSALAALDARQSKDVLVTAHTDRVGTKKENHGLSRKRAERIKEILTARGIASQAVETAWHGEDKPLIKTADGVAEPRNRRIDLTIK